MRRARGKSARQFSGAKAAALITRERDRRLKQSVTLFKSLYDRSARARALSSGSIAESGGVEDGKSARSLPQRRANPPVLVAHVNFHCIYYPDVFYNNTLTTGHGINQ